MLKIATSTLFLAAATLAIPALAGNGWPQGPSGTAKAASTAKPGLAVKAKSAAAPSRAGFSYSGEGVGWEPSQHKYTFTASGLSHSDECDHAMRTAAAIDVKAIEAMRKQYPGG